jgi:hypothetical protein
MHAQDPEPEIKALRALPREVDPSRDLEQRVVTALRRDGLLQDRRTPAWWQIAAGLLLFAAGAGAGALLRPSPDVTSSRDRQFMLLLYKIGEQSGTEAERVAAYGEWAANLREGGRQISGARLADVAVSIPESAAIDTSIDSLQGYFVVSAADVDDARRVAAESPHVRYGGRVVVRPIDLR